MAGYEHVPYPWSRPYNYQNNQLRPRNRQPREYRWVWPRDGKRDHTSAGRFLDIFAGKGPDVFVSANNERPTKSRWANRAWLDPHLRDNTTEPMSWANRKDNAYNFRTRRYENETFRGPSWDPYVIGNPFLWTDVIWGAEGGEQMPYAYRCAHGDWYQFFGDSGVEA